MNYVVYAALAEETNEGWVWVQQPQLPTRTLIKILNTTTNRSIFCVSRQIDPNFLADYNDEKKHNTIKINDPAKAIVISEWYRDALGGFPTSFKASADAPIPPLIITEKRPRNVTWSIRAACQHPESAVRIGTRLGVLGGWLGILGIAAPSLDFFELCKWLEISIFLAVAIITAAAAMGITRGIRPPLLRSR
jgi:hypothetical protein